MICTFDIGNTNVHIGLYQNGCLVYTQRWRTQQGFERKIIGRLLAKREIEGVAIASVVPNVSKMLTQYLRSRFGIKPFFINARIKMPVKIAYGNLGPDRIAAINGGYLRYHDNIIIFSLGTAITGDVVTEEGIHCGGIILPGPDTQLWSLTQKTALISKISLNGRFNLLGKNTTGCVRSGILNSTKFTIERFIEEIKNNYKKQYRTIITGGWAPRFAHLITGIDRVDEDLILYGIFQLYQKNVSG
ncbi:MAG: type III pantothenate kinase [candidate division WOR-3 bacterium]